MPPVPWIDAVDEFARPPRDCKLAGTGLSEGTVRDVGFERCDWPYTNLRMSALERVAFDGSELRSVTVDAARFQRVDLRGATALDLVGVGDLGGCLVTEAQAHQLAVHLALAAGASLEREN